MIKKPYVTRGEWEKHINAHPLVVHDIWPRIKNYLTIDPSHIIGLATGAVAYGTGVDTGLEGDATNFFWDAVNKRLGILGVPDCALHINSPNASVAFKVTATARPWMLWDASVSGYGFAAGIDADDSKFHFNYDIPSGTIDKNLVVIDGANALIGIRETAPTCRVHINSVGANIPALNLESGAEGELVTPDGQQIRIGHWNAGTTTFTERMKIDDNGKVFVSYLSVGSVLVSGAGGELVQDNARFFYNVGLHRLAIGHMGPTNSLHIDDVGTTAGWGGAYGGVIARFTCTQTPSKHTAVVIDAVAGYDAVLGLCEGGGVVWALRHNEDDHAFQVRYHVAVNRVDFAIDTSGNVTIPTGYLGILGQHELRFYEGVNYVGFEAPALGGNQIWVLPAADGPANEVLGTDNAGNLIWQTHDELAGFEANEHVALPNTIANVLSDHNVAAHDALGLSHDDLVDVSIDDHHARDHQAEHGPGGDDALKLDDLTAPDDTVDLDFSTAKHGLVPKGTDVGHFLKDDGSWAAVAGGTDEKVAIDDVAVPGYLGAAGNDGVLRVDSTISYADGGNFVTLGVDASYIEHHDLSGLADDDHTQYILHSLAGVANDFLVASGANTYIKKTLAQTGAILEGDMHHDNLQGFEANEHVALPNTIANVLSDHNVAAHDALGLSHDDLADVSIDDHHARDHAAEHEVGGDDLVNHDSLTGFVAAEHLLVGAIDHDSLLNYAAAEHLLVGAIDHNSLLNYAANRHLVLPNTIANVLSDHNKAAHDALNIDADTLDSISSSGFLATAYLQGRSLSNPDNADVAGVTAYYLAASNGTHPPGTDHALLTLSFSNAWSVQMAGDWRTNNWYVRKQENTAWGSWAKLWHEGNDGPGSGLNADTVDGEEAAAIVTKARVDAVGADHGALSGKGDNDHTQYILHSLADAANDFLVASGANTYVKKTLAQTGAILEGDMHHDNLQGFVANEHIDHSGVSIIAGSGLSGGGTIAASRTLNLGALTGNWDAGAFEIRAKTFESDQATGTAPLTVASTTKVTNLNADLLEGYHAASAATVNTVALRNASGYLFAVYFNMTNESHSSAAVTHYLVENANDNYLRWCEPADFVTQLAADGLARTSRKLDDFGTPDDNTDLNATTLRHGLLPKLGGGAVNYLRADGTWAAPGGGGLTTYFRTYRAAAQAFGTGVDTRVLWDTEKYDIGGNVTTIFTAPANGYYYLHACVGLNSLLAATAGYVRFRKTGPVVLAQTRFTGPAGLQSIHVTAQLYLTSGTWVEVTVFHNRGSNINVYVGDYWTYFEGHRLDA